MAMTQVIIAIISVGLILAALLIGMVAWLRSDNKQLREDLTTIIYKQSERIDNLSDNLSKEIASLAERFARLEGLMEGLFLRHSVIPQNNPDKTESPARTGTDG